MKQNIYVTTKDIMVAARYTEPMYDDAPWAASISRDVHVTIPVNSRVYLDENGNIEDVYACGKDITNGYGTSVYEGYTAYYQQNVKSMIGNEIKIVSQKEWDRIREVQSCYNHYYQEYCYESNICDDIEWMLKKCNTADSIAKVITAKDYEEVSESLWNGAFNYIEHMKSQMLARAKMEEYKVLGAA